MNKQTFSLEVISHNELDRDHNLFVAHLQRLTNKRNGDNWVLNERPYARDVDTALALFDNSQKFDYCLHRIDGLFTCRLMVNDDDGTIPLYKPFFFEGIHRLAPVSIMLAWHEWFESENTGNLRLVLL